ncbi:MAG TPA: hypothetical protein VGJ84_13475 [Polyangiaceae bacterium]
MRRRRIHGRYGRRWRSRCTLGAILATEQLGRATDGAAASVLRRIARDEARHAELAWSFAKWAIEQGGDAVRDAIASAVEHAVSETLRTPIVTYDVDLATWHAHGRVTCAEAHAVALQGIDQVIVPCARALLGSRLGRLDSRAFA